MTVGRSEMNDCHDPLAIVHEMGELQIQPRTEESESQILVAEATDLVWAEEPQYGITTAGSNRIEEEETEHYMDPGFDAEGDDPPGANEEWMYFKKKAAGGDAKGSEKAKIEKVKPAKKKGKENEHREDHTCASTSKVNGKEATKGWIANRATDVLRVDTTVGAKKLQQQLEQLDTKDGFLVGCRPYLGVDSTHLTGRYQGQLAAATSIDGHNWITSSYKIKEDIKTLFLYSTGQPGANNKKHCSFAIYSN
ncbi:hypothetical protein E2562_005602 [Oryza meyeriana var. granulata]|uniref:Uncharacterized protein n=1 Tax=Oryza meyeriana var. granulata TaxID=110450 RepID=A0A6G1F490_9ORYZ|nr:hypothetical protein E2562_005602 [Oryza meyeriana var. granulata]